MAVNNNNINTEKLSFPAKRVRDTRNRNKMGSLRTHMTAANNSTYQVHRNTGQLNFLA